MSDYVENEQKKKSNRGAMIIIVIVLAMVFSMMGSMGTLLWISGKIPFLPLAPVSITKNLNQSNSSVTIPSKITSNDEIVVQVADIVSRAVVKVDILKKSNQSVSGFREVGHGSGFVVSPDGYLVTNNHVVDSADKLIITFKDGKSYTGKVVGTDPISDLAVVKINEKDLEYLKLANSDEVKVGQTVVAIGNPYEYEYTVTTGVVSGVQREIQPPETQKAPTQINPFDFGNPFFDPFGGQQQQQQDTTATIPMVGIIQTDADINPGNSGGPLVNLSGEVIGVNFLITSQGTGLGFAISSNTVSKVKNDLIEFGKVSWPSLGITITANSDDVAAKLELQTTEGTVVITVPAGNAKAAGIKKNDVILGVDGKKMLVPEQIITYIRSKNVGDTVKLSINRDGKMIEIPVKLQELNTNQ